MMTAQTAYAADLLGAGGRTCARLSIVYFALLGFFLFIPLVYPAGRPGSKRKSAGCARNVMSTGRSFRVSDFMTLAFQCEAVPFKPFLAD
jgi:hypothetical protein